MIDVYIYETKNIHDVILPDNLDKHCNRYLVKKKQKTSRYAYYLLANILKNKNYNPSLITFTNDGKPIHPEISFSISHSNGYIAIATSKDEVGIDVEDIFVDRRLKMATRILTEEELNIFNKKLDQTGYLTEKWTLKESYAKYLGTGITKNVLQTTVKGLSINVKGAVVSVYPKDNNMKLFYEAWKIY